MEIQRGSGVPEEAFRLSMRRQREAKDLSQRELAEQMAARGFSWRQSTVAKTESGERPIRLNEAVALAELVGLTLDDMLQEDSEFFSGLRKLESWQRHVEYLRGQVELASSATARHQKSLDDAEAEWRKSEEEFSALLRDRLAEGSLPSSFRKLAEAESADVQKEWDSDPSVRTILRRGHHG